MNLDLVGKNAFVGGSSKGIGKAIAQKLAELGANIILTARTENMLEEVVESLDTSKGQFHSYVVLDFSDRASVKTAIEQITKDVEIHILINNTGGPAGGSITDATEEYFLNALNNHLLCGHILVQSVLEGMKKVGYGRIINVISSSVKEPIVGLGVSNTTRAAVASWAKTLASEVGQYGITVNNLLPGFIDTERLRYVLNIRATNQGVSDEEMQKRMEAQIPIGRFGNTEEIANVAAFLASPAASYLNGINVPVDGGKMKSL